MASRPYKFVKKEEKLYETSIDTFIERLKKARALNCNPSDIGMDEFVFKRTSNNRPVIVTKFW